MTIVIKERKYPRYYLANDKSGTGKRKTILDQIKNIKNILIVCPDNSTIEFWKTLTENDPRFKIKDYNYYCNDVLKYDLVIIDKPTKFKTLMSKNFLACTYIFIEADILFENLPKTKSRRNWILNEYLLFGQKPTINQKVIVPDIPNEPNDYSNFKHVSLFLDGKIVNYYGLKHEIESFKYELNNNFIKRLIHDTLFVDIDKSQKYHFLKIMFGCLGSNYDNNYSFDISEIKELKHNEFTTKEKVFCKEWGSIPNSLLRDATVYSTRLLSTSYKINDITINDISIGNDFEFIDPKKKEDGEINIFNVNKKYLEAVTNQDTELVKKLQDEHFASTKYIDEYDIPSTHCLAVSRKNLELLKILNGNRENHPVQITFARMIGNEGTNFPEYQEMKNFIFQNYDMSKNHYDKTVFDYCKTEKALPFIKDLIDHGVNIDLTACGTKRTLLINVIEHGYCNEDFIKFLIDNGASLTHKACLYNGYPYDAIDLISRKGSVALIKYLEEKGHDFTFGIFRAASELFYGGTPVYPSVINYLLPKASDNIIKDAYYLLNRDDRINRREGIKQYAEMLKAEYEKRGRVFY